MTGRTPMLRLVPARLLALAAALGVTLCSSRSGASFEIGFYDHSAARLCDLGKAGVSLVVVYLGPEADAKKLLDEAARCRVRLALQVETRLPPDRDDLGRAETLVREHRRHPALAAWYAFDEPELRHSPRRVNGWLGRLRALDPEHPLLVVFSGSERAHAFAGMGDILGLDYYPVGRQAPLSGALETIVPLADRLLAWTRTPRRSAYFIVQSFSWSDYPSHSGCRFPTLPELRYLAYSPIVSGVDGLVFWTRYRTPEAKWRDVVAPVMRELAALRPSLDRNQEGRVVGQGSIRARVLPDGLVIAVNDQPRPVATVRIEGPATDSHAEVVGEARRLPTIRGVVVDSFAPYGVHVYRFCGGRGRPCRP
jgi:hypothetical protein